MMNITPALLGTLALVSVACGGDNGGTPTSPTNTAPPAAATTITITANGVSPQRITVPLNSRVTFVNNDNRSHEMHSDPHPAHGDCPQIDEVGFLAAGQSKQTGAFTVARTCSFHDHNQPGVATLRGEIIVQ